MCGDKMFMYNEKRYEETKPMPILMAMKKVPKDPSIVSSYL
jgi:hypothetical protein